MRRIVLLCAIVLIASGCWPTPGAGPDRRSFNPFERTLTPATVGRLTEAFRVPLADGAGPPVVTPAGLFVRSGLTIAAFEARTGEARWTVQPTGYGEVFLVSNPFVLAGDQVLASASTRAGFYLDSAFVVIDARTGTSEQRTPAGRLGSVRGDSAAVGDEVFNHGDTYNTIGVRSLGGGPDWGGLTFENVGHPTLGQGRLFMGGLDRVQAYDTTTPCPPYSEDEPLLVCRSEWTRPVGPAPTPVVIGDDATVYVGTAAPYDMEGQLLALDAESGGIRFSVGVGAGVNRPPALAGGTLYVATMDGRLSAAPAAGCGAHFCRTTWTTATASEITAQPAVAGGVVYVGSADGTLRAFDAGGCGAATCEPLWTVDAGGPVTGGLAVYGGMLYVGTGDALVAYGLPR